MTLGRFAATGDALAARRKIAARTIAARIDGVTLLRLDDDAIEAIDRIKFP